MTFSTVFIAIVAAILLVVGFAAAFARINRPPSKQQAKHPRNSAAPNWNTIQSYADLSDAVQDYHFLSEDAFLSGPFQRYLELASDPNQSPRASARIMEFCRGSLNDFAQNHSDDIEDAAALNARAREMAEAWFAAEPHGEYMLEVLDGISNHNYRGTYE